MVYNLSAQISNNSVIENQCIWRMFVTYINKDTLKPETLKIEYPLTVDFNITKRIDGNTATATFRIYNLAPSTRANIYQERFNTGVKKLVTFEAGYGAETEVFKGYIQEAYSERQGVDMITTIEAWDIGLCEQCIAVTFEAGTTFKDAYKNIASQVKDLAIGEIGELNGTFKTPVTFLGTPLEILNKITNYHTFVDNGTVKTLQNNECIDVPVHVIQSESGLLGTPIFRGGQITVRSIFQPEIKIGQLYEIKSVTSSNFDGTYKVCGFTHSGTISGATAGQRITEINLLVGAILPNSNYIITGNFETGFKKVKLEEVTPVNNSYGASVEEVYRYIRDTKGDVPNKQITSNINWREMLVNNNQKSDIYNEATREILYNVKTKAEQLQSHLNQYFNGKKVKIVSGWRTRANNASVGGKTGKNGHLYGNAIDFGIVGYSSQQLFNVFNSTWGKNIGFVKKNTASIIHVQNSWRGA